MSTRTSDSIELSVMKVLCKRFKSGITKSFDPRNPLALLKYDFEPSDYVEPKAFAKDYLIYSFLRKWKGWSLSIDPAEAAFSSWTRAERQCYQTNERLTELPSWTFDLISRIQRKIVSVIDVQPCFDETDALCRWSGGSTFDLRRGTPIAAKMSNAISVTVRCRKHLERIVDQTWLDNCEGFSIVDGNRMVMVPKTSLTDRPIAAEPTGNAFVQQGVGRFIRRRLKSRCGVDLRDQKINQDLAFRAIVEDLSTIDLSMASDTLSRSVVHLLLPPAWVTFLEDLRSPKTYFGGKWYVNNKFSSMGNAYTFELESLIFYAIVYCVCETDKEKAGYVSVFGDDIICHRSFYSEVEAALSFFGFTVNTDKSYKDGSFFESCGKQYFDLEDVTPVFQKEVCGTSLFELIRLHNRLYRWGFRNGLHLVKDALKTIIEFTKRKHPKLKELPYQPLCDMDVGFITEKLRKNKNGDFPIKTALLVIPGYVGYAQARDVRCALAYKLRNPKYKSPSPDGQASYSLGERTVLRSTVVWNSTVMAYQP